MEKVAKSSAVIEVVGGGGGGQRRELNVLKRYTLVWCAVDLVVEI